MPGSWLGPADGDYQSFTPARGDLLEVKVVDGEGAEQGTLLVAVVSRQECHGPGEAFEGHCLGASDECYRYWITEGEGRHLRESGLYHLCFKSIAECRIWRGKKEVVHTDHFRFVTPSDLKEGKIRWARTRDVKAEILGQLAKFEAKYPVARPRGRVQESQKLKVEREVVRPPLVPLRRIPPAAQAIAQKRRSSWRRWQSCRPSWRRLRSWSLTREESRPRKRPWRRWRPRRRMLGTPAAGPGRSHLSQRTKKRLGIKRRRTRRTARRRPETRSDDVSHPVMLVERNGGRRRRKRSRGAPRARKKRIHPQVRRNLWMQGSLGAILVRKTQRTRAWRTGGHLEVDHPCNSKMARVLNLNLVRIQFFAKPPRGPRRWDSC